jgi:hypothetical protein
MALIERLRELRSAGCIILAATHDLDVGEKPSLRPCCILHEGPPDRALGGPTYGTSASAIRNRLQAGAAS